MILSKFPFMKKRINDRDPSEIIPISFNAYNVLEENRNSVLCERNEGKFLIQIHSQAKTKWHNTPGSNMELGRN